MCIEKEGFKCTQYALLRIIAKIVLVHTEFKKFSPFPKKQMFQLKKKSKFYPC